jgi:hypothetical protein
VRCHDKHVNIINIVGIHIVGIGIALNSKIEREKVKRNEKSSNGIESGTECKEMWLLGLIPQNRRIVLEFPGRWT